MQRLKNGGGKIGNNRNGANVRSRFYFLDSIFRPFMRVSVIIPAFNEEANIEKAVDACARALTNPQGDFEVIAVNDGSSDRTGAILEEIARSRPWLHAFHHPHNRGMGAGVQTGLAHARGDFIFITSADLQFDMQEIGRFLSATEEADIAIGYRDVRESYSWYRRMNSFANMFLLRALFGLRVRNANWVKMVRREVFEAIPVTHDGFFWDSALLIQAQKKGFRFAEVPTSFYPRAAGVEQGANPVRVLKTFLTLLRFWSRMRIRGAFDRNKKFPR